MNTYKIIVLGASGSGKSFFLASIIKWLPLPDVMVIGILREFIKNGLERKDRSLKERERVSLEASLHKEIRGLQSPAVADQKRVLYADRHDMKNP